MLISVGRDLEEMAYLRVEHWLSFQDVIPLHSPSIDPKKPVRLS